ncbi:hypothetical protein GF385_02540 [Candidatus Dependentiae bacterium]|nr:hypothetical protein [Candidatus Dependentiae bacterium]
MGFRTLFYSFIVIFSFSFIMAETDNSDTRNLNNLSEVLSNIAGQVNSQRTIQDSNSLGVSNNKTKINEIITATANAADTAAFLVALKSIDIIE